MNLTAKLLLSLGSISGALAVMIGGLSFNGLHEVVDESA
jgi:hypothetical protein